MRRMYSRKELKKIIAELSGLPEVTPLDNGKVLEVIAGAWAKGRKKVNVIDAPATSTLTDDIIDIIAEGTVMNGDLHMGELTYHNPMLFGFDKSKNQWRGYGIACGVSYAATSVLFEYIINKTTKVISVNKEILQYGFQAGLWNFLGIDVPEKPTNAGKYTLIYDPSISFSENKSKFYKPVAVTGITSGDDLAGVQNNLVNAMKDHLDVEINGFRARYQYEENGYVVYSSMAEVDSGVNLQINMISLLIASPNTISFNQMKFAPVV